MSKDNTPPEPESPPEVPPGSVPLPGFAPSEPPPLTPSESAAEFADTFMKGMNGAPPPAEVADAINNLGGQLTRPPQQLLTAMGERVFNEAPASFYTIVYRPSPSGFHWVSITVRGVEPMDTMSRFAEIMERCANSGWKFNPPNREETQGQGIPAPVGAPAMPTPPTGSPPPPPKTNETASDPPTATRPDNGTARIKRIVVGPKDKGEGLNVKFFVEGFEYPFPDSRSPETIAKSFDENIGFTADHFRSAYEYDCAKLNLVIYADWQRITKPSSRSANGIVKYYNVLRVHR